MASPAHAAVSQAAWSSQNAVGELFGSAAARKTGALLDLTRMQSGSQVAEQLEIAGRLRAHAGNDLDLYLGADG